MENYMGIKAALELLASDMEKELENINKVAEFNRVHKWLLVVDLLKNIDTSVTK